eukprot:5413921-Prymnesium_polylepis.2
MLAGVSERRSRAQHRHELGLEDAVVGQAYLWLSSRPTETKRASRTARGATETKVLRGCSKQERLLKRSSMRMVLCEYELASKWHAPREEVKRVDTRCNVNEERESVAVSNPKLPLFTM